MLHTELLGIIIAIEQAYQRGWIRLRTFAIVEAIALPPLCASSSPMFLDKVTLLLTLFGRTQVIMTSMGRDRCNLPNYQLS